MLLIKRSTLCKVKDMTRRLTCTYTNGFDTHGTINACDRLLKPERKPRRGELASSAALSIGTVLCLIAILSPVGKIDTAQAISTKKSIITVTPKAYAKALLNDNKQYKCIIELYNKESNWRPEARNGSHYGIPQLRNEIMLSKNPLQQVDLGIKYIAHRYGTTKGTPNVCKALKHLQTKGWH
jgi:hypothetical protein